MEDDEKISKDTTKCDQEELCQLFGSFLGFRNEICFAVISVTWLQGSSSSSIHSDRGPGQGKRVCYSRLKGCFSHDRLIRAIIFGGESQNFGVCFKDTLYRFSVRIIILVTLLSTSKLLLYE